MTENQPYQVTRTESDFELRSYPAGLQIQTEVQGEFLRAGNLGFRPLVAYISGSNKAGKSISMTAPVIQESTGASKHLVRFVLPANMDLASTPAALDKNVRVIEVPAHLAAARQFKGSWSEDKFQAQGKALIEALLRSGLETVGSLYFARFDPPWKPGFLKRNEVLIRVKS